MSDHTQEAWDAALEAAERRAYERAKREMAGVDPTRFAVVLKEELERRGKPPAWLRVETAGGTLVVLWGAEMHDRQRLAITEAAVIENDGPAWVARLMTVKRKERIAMLEDAQ